MATKAKIKKEALSLLGVLRLGQSFQTQDNVRMDEAYDQVFSKLTKLGLATWVTAGPIPDELVPHVVSLMAQNAVDTYGVSDSRYQRIVARAGDQGAIALREIRLLTHPDYESLDEPVDF